MESASDRAATDAGSGVRGVATRARGRFLQIAATSVFYALAHSPGPCETKMRFHFVMMLIVILVSLSMHGMASAAPAVVSSAASATPALEGATVAGAR
jgi:hypothetical protein